MIRLICVPYHLGRRGVGMGAGPEALLTGAAEVLRGSGHQVAPAHVDAGVAGEHDIGAYFAVQRALAGRVRAAVRAGEFPFVLGGNCGCVLGATAGLDPAAEPGVIWFDAHADAHTPDTSTSGFLDGMPLAALTGHCWHALTRTIPGFRPLPGARVLLAGARAIDRPEQELLRTGGVRLWAPAVLAADPGGFLREVWALTDRAAAVHLHLDLDVIDLTAGRANEFAEPGGPARATLLEAVSVAASCGGIASASLTSYDPAVDVDGRARAAALDLIGTVGAVLPQAG